MNSIIYANSKNGQHSDDGWSLDNFEKGSISQGRMWVYLPHHPRSSKNGQILRAWAAYELYHGVLLKNGEVVHHKNEKVLDDTKENLERTTRGGHNGTHKSTKIKRSCLYCGTDFLVKPSQVARGGGKFCSRKCGFKNKRRNTEYVTNLCAICGKEFRITKADASRRAARWCSLKCRKKRSL